MAKFRLSRLAEADLVDIGTYSLDKWGEGQTIRYIDALEACCGQLGDNPELGRACDQIRSGLRRMEHGRHVIFYRIELRRIWYLVSSISACCQNDRVSTKNLRSQTVDETVNAA
jgi:toxin ParE1/3/4